MKCGNEIDMNGRFLIWAVAGATFLVTVGISSWRNGLWETDPSAMPGDTPSARAARQEMIQTPSQPFAPSTSVAPPIPRPVPAGSAPTEQPAPAAQPVLAAVPPAPAYPQDASAPLSPEMTEGLLESGPGVDNTAVLARRDSAAGRNRQSH